MGSSTSSARSTACRPPVAWLCARRGALPWSRRWKPGCAPNAPNSPGTMQSPRRSTTCSRDGRICLSNNAAERALRGLALGRKSWLFAGSERGAERAALMYTLIHTAKLNDVDPQAWLADVLARIADHPVHRLDELLPWNWAVERQRRNLAA